MIFATIYSCWLPGNQGCLLITQMDSNSSSLSNLLGILGMGTSQYFTTTSSPLTKVPEGTGLGCFCTWSSVIPLGGICFQPFTPQIPENGSSGDSRCLQGSVRKIPSKYRFWVLSDLKRRARTHFQRPLIFDFTTLRNKINSALQSRCSILESYSELSWHPRVESAPERFLGWNLDRFIFDFDEMSS